MVEYVIVKELCNKYNFKEIWLIRILLYPGTDIIKCSSVMEILNRSLFLLL